jgi:hypothetical protein
VCIVPAGLNKLYRDTKVETGEEEGDNLVEIRELDVQRSG